MKGLKKYIFVMTLALAILFLITFAFKEMYLDNHVRFGETPEITPMYIISGIFVILLFLGFPIFVVVLSGIYMAKEKSYLKSLLIPLIYIGLSIIYTFIWIITMPIGEPWMILPFAMFQMIATIILCLIVNVIILAVKK